MTTKPRERMALVDRLERVRAREAATYIPRPPVRHVPLWQRMAPVEAVVLLILLSAVLAVCVAAAGRVWGW